jgi:hypothetical protein
LFGIRPFATAAMLLVIAALGAVVVGCSAQGATFVDANGSYTESSVMKLASGIDSSKLAGTSADQSTDLRHDALTTLRSRGGSAVPIADMLTKTFSAETRGVPMYVERASFNGKPAVVMIEAAGPARGKLSTKRVWVLDEQGDVLFVGTK